MLPLRYRSRRIAPGRTGAALNLTPRALGWRTIHFAVRHLAAGAVWSGRTGAEERCLVLLRGLFEVSWDGTSHRVGPRADVFGGYPHAVYLPAGHALPGRRPAQPCEIADCRAASSRRGAEPRVIRPEDCGFEIRGGGNATRQIVDIVPPAFPADRLLLCEVLHAGRQLVELSAAQARHRQPAARGRSRRGLLLPLPRSATATDSSASTPGGATRRCASRTATSSRCATAITRLLQPMATMPIT